ncbi:HAD-IIA family hydrolase [Devriesea agamarum]|uniref:HAD-IIA family hydrolase n=1 Tax=Devriesea agamarum TaxID=472569 RepID=UPI00071E5FE7|nr:HAD-IIA family hydrolase [Devriesea agamarum]
MKAQSLPILTEYDALLLDLDGCVMHGSRPIDGAASGVAKAREAGRHIAFVTNNASRTPDQVIAHLETVGVIGTPDEVTSSPQVAVHILREQHGDGARVLVIGGDSLASELSAAGLVPVRSADEQPVAVVQGWSADVDWAQLAEGAYAIGAGASYVATNTDLTLPTERGMAPGNGSLVAALRAATGKDPIVAGKPQPEIFRVAASRCGARSPLIVGDRLDTDIEGGQRADMDSALTLTGVSTILDALYALPIQRPTHLIQTLDELHTAIPRPVVTENRAVCGAASALLVDEHTIELSGADFYPAQGSASEPVPGMSTARATLALIASQFPHRAFVGRLVDAQGREVTAFHGN